MTRAGSFRRRHTHAAPPPPPPPWARRRGRLPARSREPAGSRPVRVAARRDEHRPRTRGLAATAGPRQPPPPDELSGGRLGEPGGPRRDPRCAGKDNASSIRLRTGTQPLSRPPARHRGHHHSESSWDSIARRCSREQVSQNVRGRPFSTATDQVSVVASSSACLPQKSQVFTRQALRPVRLGHRVWTEDERAPASQRRGTRCRRAGHAPKRSGGANSTEAGYDEWSSYPASVVTAIRSSGEVSRGRERARVAPAVRPAQPCG